jgi:glutamine amidotransferase
VILPGVGTFGATLDLLRASNLDTVLSARMHAGRPTLSVCVGLQILAETSTEVSHFLSSSFSCFQSPGYAGLCVVPGHVSKFPSGFRVPQQGWNAVTASPSCKILKSGFGFFSNSFCLRTAPIGFEYASLMNFYSSNSHYCSHLARC